MLETRLVRLRKESSIGLMEVDVPQKKLLEIFRNTFIDLKDKDDAWITACTRGDLSSWDSASHFILVTCVEEEYGISLDDETIVSMNSFFDVYRAIEERKS